MRRFFNRMLPLLAVVALAAACGDDDDGMDPEGPFDLTFAGDATFQDPHGGQDITVAVLDADGNVVETMSGTVSATADPSFSFTFDEVLPSGEAYGVDYWIDSNFGGGTEGTCDPPANDHQWRLEFAAVDSEEDVTDTHRPGETEAVCDSF